MELFKKTRNSRINRIRLFTTLGVLFSGGLALTKIITGLFLNGTFLYLGIFSFILLISKIVCMSSFKFSSKTKKYYINNSIIGSLIFISGIFYIVYTVTALVRNSSDAHYTLFESLFYAVVGTVELIISIINFVRDKTNNRFIKDLRIINLIFAFNAILTMQIALLSFTNHTYTHGNMGLALAIGILTVLLGIYVILAPHFGLIEHKYNVFLKRDENKVTTNKVILYKSYVSGDYVYKFKENKDNNKIVGGYIYKSRKRNKKTNLVLKILFYAFIYIYIIPLLLINIFASFRSFNIHKKLEKEMNKLGFTLIESKENESL